jgi:hypothetical protein
MMVLLALLLVGGLVLGLRLIDSGPAPDAPTPDADGPSGGEPRVSRSQTEPHDNREGGIQVGLALAYKDLPRSFVGRGHITGIVEIVGGQPFPERWKLVIEPSKFGTGREHAEYREREFDGNERTFEETDLPLGGYTISAQAAGLNSRPQELLLFAIPGTPSGGKLRAHLILHLTPTGFIDGAVRDEAGAPVADLPVLLECMGDMQRYETVTNGAGVWRIDGLVDGRFKLYLSQMERPLLPAKQINFIAPQRQLEDLIIPVTQTVTFKLTDVYGQPVDRARVRGFGVSGGWIACEGDFNGEAQARFLPAGRYKVNVDSPDGLRGQMNFELIEGDAPRRIEVRMRRPER